MSKQVPISQPNPFEPRKAKKTQALSIKYCAWEVLREKPGGLVLEDLIKEIEDRELRHFSGKKSSTQIVAGELTKQKEYFIHHKEKNLWCINPEKLADSEETESDESIKATLKKSEDKKAGTSKEEKKTTSLEIKQQNKDVVEKSEEMEEKGKGGGGGIKKGEVKGGSDEVLESKQKTKASTSSRKRALEGSLSPNKSPRKKARGAALVGLSVQVWWVGEQQYFPGKISSYNEEINRYNVAYEDGDIDNDLEIRKYEIMMKRSEIEYVKIDEHNMDDSDGTGAEEDDDDEKEEEGVLKAEKEENSDEKQLSDEGEKEV